MSRSGGGGSATLCTIKTSVFFFIPFPFWPAITWTRDGLAATDHLRGLAIGWPAQARRSGAFLEALASQLAAIVESSYDAIIGKTINGTIVTWNQGAERMYGYSADEVIGRPISILSPSQVAG